MYPQYPHFFRSVPTGRGALQCGHNRLSTILSFAVNFTAVCFDVRIRFFNNDFFSVMVYAVFFPGVTHKTTLLLFVTASQR